MDDAPSPSPDRAAVIADLDPVIRAGRIVAIGEVLGTNEFPALVVELVDEAIGRGLDVIVGLELPMSEDPAGGVFGPFWHRAAAYRDGRSSEAMARLVGSLAGRVARGVASSEDPSMASGIVRDVVAMDGPWVAPGSPIPLHLMDHLERPRDETMADRLLRSMDRHPKAFTVVLADAAHTRCRRDPSPTLGSIVSSWHPRTICLLGQTTGGQSWVLSGDDRPDGAYPMPAIDLDAGAWWAPEPGPDGHHGTVTIGPVTASPPWEPGPTEPT